MNRSTNIEKNQTILWILIISKITSNANYSISSNSIDSKNTKNSVFGEILSVLCVYLMFFFLRCSLRCCCCFFFRFLYAVFWQNSSFRMRIRLSQTKMSNNLNFLWHSDLLLWHFSLSLILSRGLFCMWHKAFRMTIVIFVIHLFIHSFIRSVDRSVKYAHCARALL